MKTVWKLALLCCASVLAGACYSKLSSSQSDRRPLQSASTPARSMLDAGSAEQTDPLPQPPPGFVGFPSSVILKRVVPTDTRKPKLAATPPVPISGGTLIVSPSGYAVAADPDRDRVSVVDIQRAIVVHTIALQPGDEPGRLVADDQGYVHVALRRAGSVVSIDLESGELLARRDVCAAPRGIAFDAAARTLRIACASGELVTLPVDGGDATQRVPLDVDLRDVVLTTNGALVSRFKRAELLAVPADSMGVTMRSRPNAIPGSFGRAPSGAMIGGDLEPEVAWRTVSDGKGGAMMLHQGARTSEIALAGADAGVVSVAYGGGSGAGGGVVPCQSVVQAELTRTDETGAPMWTEQFDAVLAVDLAVSPTSKTIAVVQAGDPDPQQPPTTLVDMNGNGFGPVPPMVKSSALMEFPITPPGPCVPPNRSLEIAGQPTAVAYADDETLLVQTREPASIAIVSKFAISAQVKLGGDSVYDTGHELFHRAAEARIACASCHAEGSDDGHVWHFQGVGPRRTQSINVGLEGTAPFHWSGDEPDVATLMEDVFVTRMGGVHESEPRTAALERWLFALSPPPPRRAADDEAALRGQALFEGDAGCSGCHNGEKLTNNTTVDVGTGEAVQVPSLRGVGYRTPLIHDGCAATLRDRFNPACGGSQHGNSADLSDAQIDDLVAYLQTL